jgi:SIR2-like protein
MDPRDFLRLHAVRTPRIAWFIGAGASVGGGIPSASHLIWEFKRTLYASREKVSLRALGDIGDPAVRLRVQQHFDRAGGFPPAGSPEEYAAYFEATYPNEDDRRRIISSHVQGAVPSFGHFSLAALMKAGRIRIVWTTNFDRLVEDGTAEVFGSTARLTTAALGEPGIATQALAEERWPFLGKLHGDFHSQRLKNVPAELRTQDAAMRAALLDSCSRFGVAVVGYSGRDQSVMDVFEEALRRTPVFPFGLFWFHRADDLVLPRVKQLIERASVVGVEAALIELETFDELMSDILLLEADLSADLTTFLESKRKRRVSPVAMPMPKGIWPVLRFNALPVEEWPTTCRIVQCVIGGTKEVREAIATAGVSVIAARRKAGIICFGPDADIRRAFDPFTISAFDLYAIEPRRLQYIDSAELGLLYEALGHALARDLALQFFPRARRLVVDPAEASTPELSALRDATKPITGTVPTSGTTWSEGVAIRLEYRVDRLWLLLEPTVWLHRPPGSPKDEAGGEFVRQRLAARYNQLANRILDGWIAVLSRGKKEWSVSTFGTPGGTDATFKLSSTTGYSWRTKQ